MDSTISIFGNSTIIGALIGGVFVIIAAIIPIVYSIRKKKEKIIVQIDNLQKLKSLVFITQPSNTASGVCISPAVIIKAIDGDNFPIKNLNIEITLKRITLKGETNKITNKNGEAIFDDLVITKTGAYELIANCNGLSIQSNSFSVLPPAFDCNYQGKKYGTDEYDQAFIVTLMNKKSSNDIIKFNGEEL